MSDLLKTILQAIPESTYDLLGRMLPGGIVVAAVAAFDNPQMPGLTISSDHFVLGIVVFAAFAYAVGVAISTLAHLIHWLAWFVVFPFLRFGDVPDRLSNTLNTITTSTTSLKLNWNPFRAEAVLDRAHDSIKQRSQSERSIVTKLFAEVSLLYSMTIATAIALPLIGNCSTYFLIPLVFLLAGFVRSVRTWYRHESILTTMPKAQG